MVWWQSPCCFIRDAVCALIPCSSIVVIIFSVLVYFDPVPFEESPLFDVEANANDSGYQLGQAAAFGVGVLKGLDWAKGQQIHFLP